MEEKKIPISILLLLLLSLNLKAQQFPMHQLPFIKSYSPEDHNGYVQTWGFAFDENGLLYTANLGQVQFFDGVEWGIIGLPNYRAYSIDNDSNGRVYVGGSGEFGFLDLPQSDSITYKQYYSLSSQLSDSIEFGIIWRTLATDAAVYFLSPRTLFIFKEKDIFIHSSQSNFTNLIQIGEEIYVLISGKGLYLVTKNELIPAEFGKIFERKTFAGWAKEGDNYVLCSFECFISSDNGFKEFSTEVDHIISEYRVYDMETLDDGSLLLATLGAGLLQITKDGKLISKISEDDGLKSNRVLSVKKDNFGNIWAGTYNGISKLDFGVPIRLFENGAQVFGIESVGGNLFYSTSSQVLMIDKTNWMTELVADSTYCRDLDNIDNILFMICDGKLSLYNDGFSKLYNSPTIEQFSFFRNEKTRIIYSNQNNVYEIGFDFLSQRMTIPILLAEVPDEISTLKVDLRGNIWIGGATNGLYKLEIVKDETEEGYNSNLSSFDLPDDGEDVTIRVNELFGEVIFLTSTGMYRFNYESESFYREEELGDFFNDTTRQIFRLDEDIKGNVWIRSERAYQGALRNNDVYEVYEGFLNRITASQSNALHVDSNGFLWLGTETGLFRIQIEFLKNYDYKFDTRVNDVLVRNDSLINGGLNLEADVLAYNDNELRFTYAAASYDVPEKTQYRVRLDGFEDDWGKWTHETFKDYTNIREGDYNFYVQARNVYGTISEALPFAFTVLPPWYRTWWAYMLYFISFSGLLYSGYKIRVNQLLKVERMRTKIASDLHDEVSATLTGISYFAEAIKRDKDQSKAAHFVSLISESAGDAKEKITDIVWSINPDNDSWELFLSKCRRFASDLLESKELEYTLNITEHIPGKLNMEVRQHLWMIFKEMVTNAVRHSKATRLDVIMDVENGTLKMIVQDNGIGFDLDEIKEGNGVRNIKKRAAKIGAAIKMHSEEDFGTRWRMELPL